MLNLSDTVSKAIAPQAPVLAAPVSMQRDKMASNQTVRPYPGSQASRKRHFREPVSCNDSWSESDSEDDLFSSPVKKRVKPSSAPIPRAPVKVKPLLQIRNGSKSVRKTEVEVRVQALISRARNRRLTYKSL